MKKIEKSLKKNAILNVFKTLVAILFPLLTFKYASKILQIENMGKINFTSSIVSYFSLIAALGISTYAIRNGAALREKHNEFSVFSNQVFTLNIVSTLFSYILLFIVIKSVPQLNNLLFLFAIQSLSIIFTTIGVEWLYTIFEDYFYITIRMLIIQLLSLILMLIFVKKSEDYYIYALILVISNAGANLFNFFHARKYINIKIEYSFKIFKHLRTVVIIFFNNITTTIYVNSDITILGFLAGDYYVGLYSVSVKIYSAMKALISAVLLVSLPRLSFYYGNKMIDRFKELNNKIFKILILITLPIITGLSILCEKLIIIISDSMYMEAKLSLRILSFALVFSTVASFINTAILLPIKKENFILKETVISAFVNISLNIILIPTFKQNGAAFTTLISEAIVMLIGFVYIWRDYKPKGIAKTVIDGSIGCVGIILLNLIIKQYLILNIYFYTAIFIALSLVIYFTVLYILKNEFIITFVNRLKK